MNIDRNNIKRNYELTKYPNIFKYYQWGSAEVGIYCGHHHNIKDIIYENRNAFVEEYNIKSFVYSLPTAKENMISDLKEKNRWFLDHFERYRTTSNKYICIASPYISKDDPKFKRFLSENDFKLFEPMYRSDASTFIIDVSDGFDKENKIQTLHKFMKVLKEDPTISPNFIVENEDFPLHTAIELNQVDVVQSLLNHPIINVNLKDQYDETPLYRAIDNYDNEIATMLLKHEMIDPNSNNILLDDKSSPLNLCLEKDNMELFELLLQHPRIDLRACNAILHNAIGNHANVATELLLQHPIIPLDDLGNTDLDRCMNDCNTFALNLLLNHPRVDVNVENESGETVLHSYLEYSSRYDMEVFQILFKHPRVNLNKKNSYGCPVLHFIIDDDNTYFNNLEKKKNIEIFKIMVENPSFDINIRDNNNQTALDFACLNNKPKWVHRLLSYSSLEDAQRTYDTVVFNNDNPRFSQDENDEIISILNIFIEKEKKEKKEKKEDCFLTEKFCMSMIQPYVPTQLKRKNPLYIGEDLVKDISSYLQWSDISNKSKQEMKIYFEDFPSL
jgi:ankyrin repeat protein